MVTDAIPNPDTPLKFTVNRLIRKVECNLTSDTSPLVTNLNAVFVIVPGPFILA